MVCFNLANQAFNSHPMLRSTPYPALGIIPGAPGVSTSLDPCHSFSGGYTLPPTAAFFPMGSYSTNMQPATSTCHQGTMVETQHDPTGLTQPNTPDLLMHRRQVGANYNIFFLACFFNTIIVNYSIYSDDTVERILSLPTETV